MTPEPSDLALLGLQAELRGLDLIMAALAALGPLAKAADPRPTGALPDWSEADFDSLPV